MKIISLRSSTQGKKHFFQDSIRETFYLELDTILLTGRNIHYPNCLIYKDLDLLNPYDEQIMSLQKVSFYENDEWELFEQPTLSHVMKEPCFFFIYNVDNYYHFIYDTLPILHAYFHLKEKHPDLNLLLQTSHPTKKELPPFVNEILHTLGIHSFAFAQPNTLYKRLYVASSLTHGEKSNEKPSALAYSVWQKLQSNVSYSLPKRFYISRRSWIHGKTENIGTNYTLKRKCINEEAIVKLFKKYDFEEIFTELLTTDQKLSLFKNAECVAGIIGGGMINLLFSSAKTKVLCIATPHFLEINKRFKHSMDHTQILYSYCADHTHKDWQFKPYSRVQVRGIEGPYEGCIGEVEEKKNNIYTLSISKNDVAGFSQDFYFEKQSFHQENLLAVDQGLNSPFEIDILQLEEDLKSLLDMK